MIVLNYDILFNIIDLNENIFSKFYLIKNLMKDIKRIDIEKMFIKF